MNKRASEKIEAGLFLLFLIIIAAGVVTILSSYVNIPVDIRSYEGQIIYDRVMNCFVENGFIEPRVFDKDYDVFSDCSLNKSAINNSGLYFEFSFRNETGEELKFVAGGNLKVRNSKKSECEFLSGAKADSSFCQFKNETYLYYNGTDVVNIKIVGWIRSDNQGVRI